MRPWRIVVAVLALLGITATGLLLLALNNGNSTAVPVKSVPSYHVHRTAPMVGCYRMVDEAEIERRVTAGGGIYRGLMHGDAVIGTETLVLFDGNVPPTRRSTLALKLTELTPHTVRNAIARKEAEFARCKKEKTP